MGIQAFQPGQGVVEGLKSETRKIDTISTTTGTDRAPCAAWSALVGESHQIVAGTGKVKGRVGQCLDGFHSCSSLTRLATPPLGLPQRSEGLVTTTRHSLPSFFRCRRPARRAGRRQWKTKTLRERSLGSCQPRAPLGQAICRFSRNAHQGIRTYDDSVDVTPYSSVLLGIKSTNRKPSGGEPTENCEPRSEPEAACFQRPRQDLRVQRSPFISNRSYSRHLP